MTDEEKWEASAKKFDDKLPDLAKALRSPELQKTIKDIHEYYGWIRCYQSTKRW